uniref:ATP-dependent Lon protease n=1 Tax=Thaumasiovibrio occultus TaxID=1891184 RepID=UPI000B35519E|nr:ATP-dependent Lon protease [Thaumasiovibrio occultus]
MNVAPTLSGAPLVAPTVNLPTEQVARDNRVREKIVPLAELSSPVQEKAVSAQEKQLRKPAWDPSEHPEYDHPSAPLEFHAKTELEQLIEMLSAGTYLNKDDTQGYVMRVKLPQKLFEELEKISEATRVKGVVSHHYATSVAPNPPVQYLVVV